MLPEWLRRWYAASWIDTYPGIRYPAVPLVESRVRVVLAFDVQNQGSTWLTSLEDAAI